MRQSSAPIIALIGLSLSAVACSAPALDISSQLGRDAILEKTHDHLTRAECDEAIATIEPLYNSAFSDNAVRMARASAFACGSGITDFLTLATTLPEKNFLSVPGEGSYLFRTAAELFYLADVDTLDARIEYASEAMQSLQSAVRPNRYVMDSNLLYSSTNNPGSALAADRTDDSNLYLVFASLSAMGALQSRYSAPDTSDWTKTQTLGYQGPGLDWSLANRTAGHGCTYAAAVLNLLDSAEEVLPVVSDDMESALSALEVLRPVFDQACNAGCTGASGSGCAIASGCDGCPKILRDPTSCTGSITNPASCAAAGLANLISTDVNFGWVGP